MQDLHFKKIGSGPTLLMLHGWRKSLDDLFPLAKLFAEKYTVYLVDLPGFGKSEAPPTSWNTNNYAELIKDFINEKQIQPIIIGHSFGGRVALQVAALYPELTKNLILIGTPGIRKSQNIFKLIRLKLIKYTGKLIKFIDLIFRTKLFENKFVPKYGSADYKAAGHLRSILVKTVNQDLSEYALQVKQPTFLLWGKYDYEAPLHNALRYKQLISNSTLEILEQHGHEPYNDVGAHLCFKKIDNFIENNA